MPKVVEQIEFGPGVLVCFYADDSGNEIVEIASNHPSPVKGQPYRNVFMPLATFMEIVSSEALRRIAFERAMR